MPTTLTIGKLAKQAAVSIDSIRFYERQGLLATPQRTASNYRLYPLEAASQLRFIKRAQNLGFSLTEIRELLELSQSPIASKADIKRKAQEKLADIQTRMADLGRILAALEQLEQSCDGHGPLGECPILNALAGDAGQGSTNNDERSES